MKTEKFSELKDYLRDLRIWAEEFKDLKRVFVLRRGEEIPAIAWQFEVGYGIGYKSLKGLFILNMFEDRRVLNKEAADR